MSNIVKLKHDLTYEQECWLTENIGPKLYHLHYKFGGKGWHVVRGFDSQHLKSFNYYISFQDERMATMFILRWS